MARVYTRKPKAKPDEENSPAAESPELSAPTVEETVATAPEPAALQPPSTPVEPTNDREEPRFEDRRGHQRDRIAASLNIAKLQAMSMNDLNKMAREYAVENF